MRVDVMDGNKKKCVGGYSLEEASQREPYIQRRDCQHDLLLPAKYNPDYIYAGEQIRDYTRHQTRTNI